MPRFTVLRSPTSNAWQVIDGLSRRVIANYQSEAAAKLKAASLMSLLPYYLIHDPSTGDHKVFERNKLSCVQSFKSRAAAERHAQQLNLSAIGE